MKFNTKKQYTQQPLYTETAKMLEKLVDIYNKRQEEEFGSRAKKVSKVAIIHNLVEMKLREEISGGLDEEQQP